MAKYAYTATDLGLVKTAEGFVTLVEGTLKSLAKVVDKAELRRIYETIGQKEWKFANGDVPTAEQMDEIIDYLVRGNFSESFEDVLKRYEQGLFDAVDGKKVLGGLEAGAKGGSKLGDVVESVKQRRNSVWDYNGKGRSILIQNGKFPTQIIPCIFFPQLAKMRQAIEVFLF